jgi:hypothetical protein
MKKRKLDQSLVRRSSLVQGTQLLLAIQNSYSLYAILCGLYLINSGSNPDRIIQYNLGSAGAKRTSKRSQKKPLYKLRITQRLHKRLQSEDLIDHSLRLSQVATLEQRGTASTFDVFLLFNSEESDQSCLALASSTYLQITHRGSKYGKDCTQPFAVRDPMLIHVNTRELCLTFDHIIKRFETPNADLPLARAILNCILRESRVQSHQKHTSWPHLLRGLHNR